MGEEVNPFASEIDVNSETVKATAREYSHRGEGIISWIKKHPELKGVNLGDGRESVRIFRDDLKGLPVEDVSYAKTVDEYAAKWGEALGVDSNYLLDFSHVYKDAD